MQMKNIMIFGDSYSTFAGYVPEGYAVYYSATDERTDVRRVEETWWHSLCSELNLNLVRNDSWSGSTLCNTGYNGDCSETNSFIYRLNTLEKEGFFRKNTIDTVFVFGCTNDNWAGVPLGEMKTDNISKEELFSVLPAIGYFIGRLREVLPHAQIVFLVNTELNPLIGDTIEAVSQHFGTSCLRFDHIDKQNGHPSVQGMRDICDQVKAFLNA